jgi:hypothetical protein
LYSISSNGSVQNGAVIDSSGNLGIGATSPVSKLQVVANQASYVNDVAQLTITGTNTNQRLLLGYNTSTDKAFIQATKVGTAYQDLVLQSGGGNLLVGITSGFTDEKVSFVSATTSLLTLRYTGATAGRYTRLAIDGSGNFFVLDNNATGQYQAYGSSAWTAISDERIKDIIEQITNAIEKVNSLRSVIGKLKKDPDGTRKVFLIAQDVQAVLPEAVNVQDDEIGTLGLQYTDVIPLLVAAIKEQQALIQSLTDRITALENR